MKIHGAKAYADKLRRLSGPEMKRQIGAALEAGGSIIQTEARLSITRGSVSGKGHIPSAPGEPPNHDTGDLIRGIHVERKGLTVHVVSEAPHAVPLEFGTSKMAERPYMRPAAQKKRAEVAGLVRQAVRKVAAGGKVVP